MTKAAMLKRLAALERENKMLRTTLEEAGWTEGRAVIREAMDWWGRKRPLSWDLTRHLQSPGVNCVWESESKFAKVCARLAAKRKAMRAK